MYAICRTALSSSLPRNLQRFAFTQDMGLVDLTAGKKYEVYGVRTIGHQSFFLVLTDTVHTRTPWWMPTSFFYKLDSVISPEWTQRSWGLLRKDVILAPPLYFDAIIDIEDGTKRGEEVFEAMKKGLV